MNLKQIRSRGIWGWVWNHTLIGWILTFLFLSAFGISMAVAITELL